MGEQVGKKHLRPHQFSGINAHGNERSPCQISQSCAVRLHSEDESCEIRRAELITRTLFKISNAVNTTKSLDELYRTIHQVLGEIMDLTNFFIAIYDKECGCVSFPYFVDEFDSDATYEDQINEENSLTGEVIMTRKAVFWDKEDLLARAAQNRVVGTVPNVWLGVPLIIQDEVIGVMAAQRYAEPHSYERIDLDIMISVSDQIALAIERKRNEQTIIANEKRYRNIIESIQDGYYEIDLRGNILLANHATCLLLGVEEKTIIGSNVSQYLSKRALLQLPPVYNAVIKRGQPTGTIEFELHLPAGSKRYVETVVSGIRADNGEVTGFRGIARDVTERKKTEQLQKEFREKMQQAQRLESLGTLAGGIAHDFNNLLMGIQGRVELMLINLAQDHPHYGQLKSIEEYTKSAAGLTARLLGFARGGKYEVRPVDLNAVVEKSIRMFARTKKEITLKTRLSKHLPAVEADAGQLEQVLINLLVNGAQAIAVQGTITVSTDIEVMSEARARYFNLAAGRYVKVSIADNGMGMNQATMDRIFEPFFTTKKKGYGTGLGLAMVYGILRNHSGAITVESTIGEGSTFTFFLPATAEDSIAETTGAICLEEGVETILLVDDEEMIIEVGREMLMALGYKVLVAGTGHDAIQMYAEKMDGIHLVIIDMIMPQMGGGELFDNLKKINPDVRVLLSSGYSIDGQAQEILERGCRGFIQKPFSISKLSIKLREVLGRE